MKIVLTLSETLQKCNDWPLFCNEFGFSEWACNEGGGHIEITLTEEQARAYGIIKNEGYL